MLVKQGNKYMLMPSNLEPSSDLPVQVYNTTFDPQKGIIELVVDRPFVLPKKIYGKVNQRAERVLNTYKDRKGNTGALLLGLKGTGKTVLAKDISIKSNLPVLNISSPIPFGPLASFLSDLNQPVVVLFDEFEKIYYSGEKDGEGDDVSQGGILTILSGTFDTNCLFLLTCNNENALHSKLLGRPGRLFYRFIYEGIDQETYMEIVDDLLKPSLSSFREEFVRAYISLGDVSVDTIKSLIEEVNRYNISPSEAVVDLNIDRENIEYEFSSMVPFTRRVRNEESGVLEDKTDLVSVTATYIPAEGTKVHPSEEDSYNSLYLSGFNSVGNRVHFELEMLSTYFREQEDSDPSMRVRKFLYDCKERPDLDPIELTIEQVKARKKYANFVF